MVQDVKDIPLTVGHPMQATWDNTFLLVYPTSLPPYLPPSRRRSLALATSHSTLPPAPTYFDKRTRVRTGRARTYARAK